MSEPHLPESRGLQRHATALAMLATLALTPSAGSGCALTTMESARQLNAGETVVSGAIEYPGYVYFPNIAVSAKHGLGDLGDIGAQVASSYSTARLGLSARLYPSDWLTLSMQVEGYILLGHLLGYQDWSVYGMEENTLNVTHRISTAAKPDRPLYGGVQLIGIATYLDNGSLLSDFDIGIGLLGAFIGREVALSPRWNLQYELLIHPFLTEFSGLEKLLIPHVQISVGLHYRFGEKPQAPRLPEASF
ncbi:hypothetical protein DL240_13735 [Lujinxingia litoralis]|uniref:Outer membrane protein beta-barrel domain-containing protein n=1 Tax=Lujinxingia litoralis TaxID=2211119 RepID=A0A328C8W9_9DELT|nr:hypothetical protein [Lujinxingia litoralis]RAL21189.1 hypothetical protein DL240_13735 [Lujinxingia litoralis]